MAYSNSNNLFPPVVPDILPAFIKSNNQCRIYFSLSIYNSLKEINHIQLSLINQSTNASALNKSIYRSGLKFINKNEIYSIPEGELTPYNKEYDYYIIIGAKDLENENGFQINQFYKIQLRFSSVGTEVEKTDNPNNVKAKWFSDHINDFSEWSKVCLIKAISQPTLSLHNFESLENENLQEVILPVPLIDIIGKLTFEDSEDKECLNSFNIKIYQENNPNEILFDSGEVYTNPHNPNEINYSVPYYLEDVVVYVMDFTYTTNNLYSESNQYKFAIIQSGTSKVLQAILDAIPDNENGRIIVKLYTENDNNFLGNFTIRRTSSKSDFHIWEDIKTVAYNTGQKLDYILYDTTVESGIWYRYCAQRRDALGTRGPIIKNNQPIMCLLDDMFLTGNGKQLKIQFNPTVSDFKINVSESQQNTIGAKFPFIKRNGNNYFKTFSIGGLISSFIDTTDWYDPHFYGEIYHDSQKEEQAFNLAKSSENEIKAFTSKDEIYGEQKSLYNNYNKNYNINDYNDYTYEKEFRNKVYDFLYKNEAKLFRSATEGNILIKLMNISFQPQTALGRRLYSFTATAVEIDEANISNYDKYGINIIGDYQSYLLNRRQVLGSMENMFDSNSGDILKLIESKYKSRTQEGYIDQVPYLSNLKLEIDSEPYLIVESEEGNLRVASEEDVRSGSHLMSGYIVNINGKDLLITPKMERKSLLKEPSNNRNNRDLIEASENPIISTQITHLGVFELKQPNTEITSLSVKTKSDNKISMSLNYSVLLEQREDLTHLVQKYYYYHNPGQLYGTFEPGSKLIRKIYNKYLEVYDDEFYRLTNISGIRLEGPQGAVVYVKDSKDTDYNRHILENGYLQLQDSQATIQGLYFNGCHLVECKDPEEVLRVNRIDLTPQEGLYSFKNGQLYSVTFTENEIPTYTIVPESELENGGVYQLVSYGFKSQNSAWPDIEMQNTLNIDSSYIEDITALESPVYVDPIDDDSSFKMVYYYGIWHPISDMDNRIKLQKSDIRHVRENEFILTNETYQSVDEIINPIRNGVYHITPLVIDNNNIDDYDTTEGILTINSNIIDKNNNLIMETAFSDDALNSNWIYYNNKWYPFDIELHDVICPIDGVVDYFYELTKGVYKKNEI